MSNRIYLKAVLLTCFIISIGVNKGASQAFNYKSSCFSAGYGIGGYGNLFIYNATFDSYTNLKTSVAGPVYLKYERGIMDNLGIGISLAWLSTHWAYDDVYYNYGSPNIYYPSFEKRVGFSAMVRLNYHFINNDKFDLYYGAGVGFRSNNWSSGTTNPNGINNYEDSFLDDFPIAFESTFGVKYLVAPNLGIYSEVGFAKSICQVGVVYYMQGK